MAVPHTSGAFGDLLDPRFQKIFQDTYRQIPDMLGTLYTMPPTNGRNNMTWSGVGAFGDFQEFTGSVTYDSIAQAYDVTATPVEFASGMQVERKLFDDEQYHIMDQRPSGLARSAQRTRQRHGARIFTNAFSVDTYFGSNSEGVALCSASHTTNASGVSTATGFSNYTTSSLSAVAVAAARIQMKGFLDDRGNKTDPMPDELWYPTNLYEIAKEIVESEGKLDDANNNINVHRGGYTPYEWNYMTDTNDWFMCDGQMRKQMLMWVDRIPLEFAFAEDLDTIVAKWRAYMRYAGAIWVDWRWVLGAQVS